MRLILHPGHAKCGSTSIQKAIIKNRDQLKKHKIIVPDPQLRLPWEKGFNPNGETPRPFFRKLMESGDTKDLLPKLENIRSHLDNNYSIIISAENLVNQLNQASGKQIHLELARYFDDTRIIYYIKRQDDFLLSAWQQWGYKQGKNFQDFVNTALLSGNPNYCTAAKFFSRVYGKKNMDVVPIDGGKLYKNNLVADFFHRLELPANEFNCSRLESNKSLNPHLCDTLSKLPHLFTDVHDESLKRDLESLVEKNSRIFEKSPDFFSKNERKRILERFKKDNDFLRNTFMDSQDWPSQPTSHSESENSDGYEEALAIQMELIIKLIRKVSNEGN
ncbi:hypothetical protein MRB56_19715 [Halomonas cupida]|uniref:Sulfotransferase family protein n=1 Tax=Halomonas cupida TaxID=44933 RepID=A0A1M7IUZ0_9GAMM|nr:hypothetical protein [Halomonas cupida]SHM44488.1 hypothetical protein SAMN05660971_02990 [Halomonas cupida]